MLNISAIKVRVSLKWQRCFGGCDYMTFRLFLGESRVLVHGWDESCDPTQEQGLGLGQGRCATAGSSSPAILKELTLRPWSPEGKLWWLGSLGLAGSYLESHRSVPSAWQRFLSGPVLSPPKQKSPSDPGTGVWNKYWAESGPRPLNGCQRCRLATLFCKIKWKKDLIIWHQVSVEPVLLILILIRILYCH